jgi:dipeptidyl aminopeptidase/acylaminoacyl peptidase
MKMSSALKLIAILLVMAAVVSCTCKKCDEKETGGISKSDSLAKQPITETRVTAELLWKFGRVADPQISPDGKNIVYCITRYSISENKSYTDLYLIPVEGGEVKQLTSFAGPESNPRWTPDGKHIGFLATESGSSQIWEMNPDGTESKQVSSVEGDINSFEYAPDGTHLLYCKNVKIDKSPQDIYPDLPKTNVMIIENLMYRHWNDWNDYTYSHIFVAPYQAGKVDTAKDIMEGEAWDAPLSAYFDNTEMSWSNDGKIIAYTCKKLIGKDYALSTNSDIFLYNVESGKTENITEGMDGYDKYPVFSPDNSKIAWQSMKTPGFESDKDRLFVMDVATKKMEDLTEGFDQSVAGLNWSADGKNIYFISGTKATFQIYKIDVAAKNITQLTKGVHDYTSLKRCGNVMIGELMSMSMATEIFKVGEDGSEKQITFTNKNIYDKIQLATVEERWMKTTDNKDMLVWIIYPPQFDKTKKYPSFLYCQGGPQSAVSQFWSYRWNFQIMAAHDYIVIAPNRRGLPTFGSEWNDQISGDYGGQNMKDYLSAVDAMKKEPFIDGEHIGCVGASYGGFSAFWLAGHHNKRFKAFIAHCGMFNLESQYGATEEMFFVNKDLGGPYWDKNNKVAQNSYANSPHRFVQNWDTPILIISGGKDFRIPYTESMQAFNAAQLLGIPSKFLFFPEESHFVLKPQNSILWQREFFGWLDKWLKPAK